MRTAIEGIKAAVIAVAICVVFAGQASAQHYGIRDYAELCPNMLHASGADMVQFLNTVKPDDSNKYCVAYFILSLGEARYEPAIPALIKLLDFVLPLPPMGDRLPVSHGIMIGYPAAGALWEIGRTEVPGADSSGKEKVLSALLGVIEAQSTSVVQQDLASDTWIKLFEYSPEGIARLKREETKATDNAVKQRLDAAIRRAMRLCSEPGGPASGGTVCHQAAETGTVPDQPPPTQQ